MKKTGTLLKEKREAANLSISEVALATKINPKILNAIENGEEKNLPAKTFLKGFLRAYAVYLKLDAEEVLRLYLEETGPPPAPVVAPVNVEPAKPAAASGAGSSRRAMRDENSSGMRTAAVVVIVLLIGVIIGVRELIEKYQREKVLESAQIKVSPLEQPPIVPSVTPATEPTSTAPAPLESPAAPMVAAPASEVVPPTESEVKPAANEVNVSTPAPTPAPVLPAPSPVVGTPPPPAPVVAPVKVEVAKAEPPKAETEKKEAEIKPDADPSSPIKNVKSEIILEALDKVEVKFQIKGETKKLSLAPTQVHTIRADQPVVFDFSDGGAVNIILNGRERGPAGELGKPKQIKLP